MPMPGFEPGTLLGYTAPPALPLSYTDLCAPACWSHTRAGRKEKRYVGLAPWSEETVVSCHTLPVVPRATDRASLQRPRIYSPPRWDQHRGHFSSFRAGSSTYGGRVKRPSVSQGQPTLHRDPVFLRGRTYDIRLLPECSWAFALVGELWA